MPEGWYFDSVTLSNSAFAERSDIIERRYAGRAFVTAEVSDEVARGVAFTGTIGILVATVRDGIMSADAADEVLHAMVETGFYSPVSRISDLL